jgi:YbbR domain-containing protein
LLNTRLDGLKAIRVAVPKDVAQRLVVPINSSDLPLPSGLSIASVEPSEVELRFDKKAVKVVPVEVPRIGRLSESYRLQGIEWEPETVQVEGPLELIRELRQVETYPIDFRTLSETEKRALPIRKPASSMTLSADEVTVMVQVSPVPAKRVFRRRQVEIRVNGGEPRTVFPKDVQVTVRGPRVVTQAMSEADVIPYVRLDEDNRSGGVVSVHADVPAGIEIESIEPPVVEVRAAAEVAPPLSSSSAGKKTKRFGKEIREAGAQATGSQRPIGDAGRVENQAG